MHSPCHRNVRHGKAPSADMRSAQAPSVWTRSKADAQKRAAGTLPAISTRTARALSAVVWHGTPVNSVKRLLKRWVVGGADTASAVTPAPLLMPLEPRIVYDASIAAVGIPAHHQPNVAERP